MNRWYRAYQGTVTDAKLGEVALVAGCSRSVAIAAWHCILESAAGCNDGGRFDVTARRIAVILAEPLAAMEAVVCAFEEIGLVKGSVAQAWAKRQYESDNSTERSRKSRERAKADASQERNVAATLQQQHATPPETDTDTENKSTHASASSLPEVDDWGRLEVKLREAAGWQREVNPMLAVVGPIVGLIQGGCDLDLDVLPAIKARAHACRGRKSWKYFIEAIQQARDDRLAAMKPPDPLSPYRISHAPRSKPHSIADSFAVIDAAIAAREAELDRLEESAGTGGQSAKLLS